MIRKILAAMLAAAAVTVGLVVISPGSAMAVGGYEIKPMFTSRCVTPVNNNSTDRNVALVLSNLPCLETWNFVDIPGSLTKYIKLDANSARCMVPGGSSTSNNAAIVSGACGTSPFFEWLPIPLDPQGIPDRYQLYNLGSKKCMAVVGNSTAAGASVLQTTCDPSTAVLPGKAFTW